MKIWKLTAALCLSISFAFQGYQAYLMKYPQDIDWSKATKEVSANAYQSTVLIRTTGALGSGVLIDARGYILTCQHVVAKSTDATVQVTFYRGDTSTGTVVWTDKDKDLALIRVKLPYEAPAMRVAEKNPEIGELVISVGHPFGVEWTVGYGIVSKYDHDIYNENPNYKGADWIQHTALTHPGNSGGPLVNLRGELVGINARVMQVTPLYSSLQINFAIDLTEIRNFLDAAEIIIPPSPELTSCPDN